MTAVVVGHILTTISRKRRLKTGVGTEKSKMMKRHTHIGLFAAMGVSFAAAAFAVTLSSTAIYSYAAEVHADFSGLSITKDGDCSWSIGDTGSLVVDKYELKLARKSSGSWSESYKTAKTTDSNYTFTISSVGQYKFKVRALFVGGDKSDWSADSDIVSVTSEDVQNDSPGSGSSAAIVVIPTGSGTTTYYPAGPGVNNAQYQYTSTTIGPDGKTVTTTYTMNGGGPGSTSGGTSNATSGWIKTGNNWIYRYANGTQPKNCWDRVGDKWYYFDANGYLCNGWVSYNGNWYYSDLYTGEMKTGFNNINEKWYYFNESGVMQTGYITVGGKVYYMDQSGARVQGGYNPDGHQFDVNGVMIE